MQNTGTLTCDICNEQYDYAPDSPPHSCAPDPRDKRIEQLEAALYRLAAWGLLLKPDAPDNEPLPSDVPHLSITMGDAKAALKAMGRDRIVCPICEGACSTNH